MSGNEVNVDIISLEDFNKTLDARIDQASFLLREIGKLASHPMPLGEFPDAKHQVTQHGSLERTFRDRIERLKNATVAAKTATTTILTNYKSAEDRNAASAKDIARQLGGVDNALKAG